MAIESVATAIDNSSSRSLARTAIEISNLYGFLAAIFRQEISAELLGKLRSVELRETLAEAGVTLDDRLLRGPLLKVLEELAVEFTALFLGPGEHISPHESVHVKEGGLLWQAETAAVRRYIQATGFQYNEEFTGMPDHISVELEFMAELTRREGEAWEKGDTDTAANCLQHQSHFMAEHLSKWASGFCSKVIARADLPFYRDIAQLTADFIESEKTDIEERLRTAKAG